MQLTRLEARSLFDTSEATFMMFYQTLRMNEDKKEAGIHRSNNDVKMLLVDKFLVLLAGNHPERFRPVRLMRS
jgi:hypothetical protein